MSRRRPARICATVITCQDCNAILQVRTHLLGTGWQGDWFMVKDSVWRRGQQAGKCRFLCVGCLERRISRKLSADDFRRSAKVKFDAQKSARLRRRMRGLKPARRLVEMIFKL
jgi:hypothetical protein